MNIDAASRLAEGAQEAYNAGLGKNQESVAEVVAASVPAITE